MRWYVGGIAEAVATSKTKNAIFVVYVEGKDDKSKILTLLIDEVEVSAKLESSNFVALKLEAGSTPHNQFAEIYKNVPVPSLFLIGKQGQPLDIITGVNNVQELSDRIDKVIVKHGGVVPIKQTTSAQIETHTSHQQQTSKVNLTETPKSEPVRENGVCHKPEEKKPEEAPQEAPQEAPEEAPEETPKEISKEDPDNESLDINSMSKEEKIQRAKELVEKKREEKKLEAEEKERQKELERRKLGQEVQKLKEWQKDQELKELMEKRKKEKFEDKAARDRILAQIAQDRADRALKFGTTSPNTNPSPVVEQTQSKPSPQGNTARLQFRLPDGSSDTNTFENDTTLQEVRNYIVETLHPPFRNFGLAMSFPRREFTPEDNSSTLLDLGLCPTAVVLIIPGTAQVSLSRQDGSITGFVWMLFQQVYGIYAYFRNWIFGAPPTVGRTEQTAEKRNAPDNSDGQQSSSKRRVTESTTVRRQGNIHRFTDRSDSDDENNTWNGNSTQQM